jgi:hypothetical protein
MRDDDFSEVVLTSYAILGPPPLVAEHFRSTWQHVQSTCEDATRQVGVIPNP